MPFLKSVNLGNYGEIPYVTIGDSAFPKYSWLIKAYNEESNVTQEKYNRTHVIRILRGPRNLFELHDCSNYRSFHTL